MTEPTKARDIVLVVDDSPETLSLLTDALDRSGAMVLVATSGPQALALVERITPDIVLMDAVMPAMDGFEACRRLKGNNALSHVPVIFMTGLTETEHIVQGLAAGGVDYVTKPIVIDELLARIRVHLANARTAQSARVALDATGRYLLATDADGIIRWSTPQALRLLATALPSRDGRLALPEAVRDQLRSGGLKSGPGAPPIAIEGAANLQLSFLGGSGTDEYLFRLTSEDPGQSAAMLREKFAVTAREADVLLWIARGKSNRDIGEILGLSHRTVNKHLEQIYAKLGVENRASAAVLALQVLEDRAR